MSDCKHSVHEDKHSHTHGEGCGHTKIDHDGHTDYVHNGHLHHEHKAKGHFHDCVIESDFPNEPACKFDDMPCDAPSVAEDFGCAAHDDGSICGPGCGHEAVPHYSADGSVHTDYLVPAEDDETVFELHCPHDDGDPAEKHCDSHGYVHGSPNP